jgi:hypothetical protein
MEEKPLKEHWSKHPLFVALVTLIISGNISGVVSIIVAVKYLTTGGSVFLIVGWAVSVILSLIIGATFVIYPIIAIFSKETRRRGYIRFLLETLWRLPHGIWYVYQDSRKEHKPKSVEETIQEASNKIKQEKTSL